MACGAERVGELVAEPGVFVGECLVALQGSGEPGAQRGVGRPLACRDGIGGCAVADAAQPLDLVTDVGLGIEPGPEDPGSGCDGANVTGIPARSSSRSAWTAFARVSSCRRPAASASGAAASRRIGGRLLRLAVVGFEGGDDLV